MAKEYVGWKFLFDVNLLIYIFKLVPLILNKKKSNGNTISLHNYVESSQS